MNAITLVLLPGLDGTEILFGPLLRHLPSWISPIVVKYPFSGMNSYEELLEIVDKEVASLGNFAIFGWSFGGPLALMIAARRPSQVSSVVLCASFVSPPHPELVPFRFIVTPWVYAIVRTLRRARYALPGLAPNELRRAKATLWKLVGARVLAARARAAMAVDVRQLLKECRVPLMYLASTQDGVVRQVCLNEVVAIMPQTRVVEVEGSHLALFTNPIESAACIADFLTAC